MFLGSLIHSLDFVRILDFVGTVIMGWAILNLPKIIKLAQDLMKRMKKYFDILTGFTQNLTVFFTGFQNNLKEIGEKLREIDFEPTLNQIKNFMRKVQDSFTRITIGTVQSINKFLGASSALYALDRIAGYPTPLLAAKQKVVVIGGGFGGATLRRAAQSRGCYVTHIRTRSATRS